MAAAPTSARRIVAPLDGSPTATRPAPITAARPAVCRSTPPSAPGFPSRSARALCSEGIAGGSQTIGAALATARAYFELDASSASSARAPSLTTVEVFPAVCGWIVTTGGSGG